MLRGTYDEGLPKALRNAAFSSEYHYSLLHDAADIIERLVDQEVQLEEILGSEGKPLLQRAQRLAMAASAASTLHEVYSDEREKLINALYPFADPKLLDGVDLNDLPLRAEHFKQAHDTIFGKSNEQEQRRRTGFPG